MNNSYEYMNFAVDNNAMVNYEKPHTEYKLVASNLPFNIEERQLMSLFDKYIITYLHIKKYFH